MTELLIFRSKSFDPWHNLAIEEILLEKVAENQLILYLWQNRDTIVIGKNQNPWKECRAVILENDGGYLARRLSGGGTVFHDLGNLNFTFLMNRFNYNLEKQLAVILTAIRKLGIMAEVNARKDLTVNGCKFSGNAFCFRKNKALHHGTILVASNFEKLAKYLQVPGEAIQAKGIESVRSPVVNLNEFCPSLTIEIVIEALCQEFIKIAGECSGGSSLQFQNSDSLEQNTLEKLYEKYASWEWRYGETPKFELTMATHFVWGDIEINLKLEKGIIREAVAYSDARDETFINMLPQALKGTILNASAMADCIDNLNVSIDHQLMQNDIVRWIRAKDL